MDRRTFLHRVGTAALAYQAPAGAAARLPMNDVIVLVPGIMGSVLRKNGKDIWAPTRERLLAALRTLGASTDELAVKGDDAGGVQAISLVQDTHLIPGLWKIDGYTEMRKYLFKRFELEAGTNYFEFPYDWRLDNRISSQRLAKASQGWLKQRRRTTGDAKLILIAHSMGGLVSLDFLERLGGWRDSRMLITLGTPFAGSPKAADFLSNGISGFTAKLPIADIAALTRTFTSVHQLLPRYECIQVQDGSWKRIAEVSSGIPGIDKAQAMRALKFHHDLDAAINRNRNDPEYAKTAYRLHPFIGTFQPTYWSGRMVNGRLEVSEDMPVPSKGALGGRNDGDGTVPRESAMPIYREINVSSARPFNQLHGSLQNDPAVLTQVEGLLSDNRVLTSGLLSGDVELSLIVADICDAGAPVEIRARCNVRKYLAGKVFTTAGAHVIDLPPRDSSDTGVMWQQRLRPGEYRVTVQVQDLAGGVSDVFLVA